MHIKMTKTNRNESAEFERSTLKSHAVSDKMVSNEIKSAIQKNKTSGDSHQNVDRSSLRVQNPIIPMAINKFNTPQPLYA